MAPATRYLQWGARLGSLAAAAFILPFLVGAVTAENPTLPTPNEWVGLAFFPAGLLIGLALGWWRDLVGGIVAVGSLIGFYAWHLAVAGDLPSGPYFLLLGLPGLLFLLAGLAERAAPQKLTQT